MEDNSVSDADLQLIEDISQSEITGKNATTKLKTDEKVLARVTDGIYRLPGSAIRELISNSYDADAEQVTIYTDAPRFESMTIKDDGNGMSVETLVNLIGHIGGSAKRSLKGQNLNITDPNDLTRSPRKKRKLIGKIGIGLFSVAQLTRNFEIITKQEGTDFYLNARVRLYNYSEENVSKEDALASQENRGASFETGDVEIWKETTKNLSAHGTDIILRDIKKSAADLLKSVDIWGQESAETEKADNTDALDSGKIEKNDIFDFMDSSKAVLPEYHIGYLSGKNGFEFFDEKKQRSPKLPWNEEDKSSDKFNKLHDAVIRLTRSRVNPKLKEVLDEYLQMLWTLSLSVPLNYIDKHPFSLSIADIPQTYIISNKLKGQAEKLSAKDSLASFSSYIPLKTTSKRIDFNVTIDGIDLYRPIRYSDLPTSSASVKKPILFLGSYSPNLKAMDPKDSAGSLAFDAYLLWSPKVVPKDHNGVLVRLHNSSGIMFDETFMKHQVAEHTIKSQLTVEIFVTEGLDSALNIDRESFNIAHPHYQIVMRWLHQAIRQVVNKYKQIKKNQTLINQDIRRSKFAQNLSNHVDNRIVALGQDPNEKPKFEVKDGEDRKTNNSDSFSISKNLYQEYTGIRQTASEKSLKIEAKSEAILQILDAYGLLEGITQNQADSLIVDLLKILSTDA